MMVVVEADTIQASPNGVVGLKRIDVFLPVSMDKASN
jgi:hypothetical protein